MSYNDIYKKYRNRYNETDKHTKNNCDKVRWEFKCKRVTNGVFIKRCHCNCHCNIAGNSMTITTIAVLCDISCSI